VDYVLSGDTPGSPRGGRALLKHTWKLVPSHALSRLFLAVTLLLLAASGTFAKPPTLEIAPNNNALPTEARKSQALAMSLKYTGDPPTTLNMVVLTPDGETVTVPTKASVGDPAKGVLVTWPYTPTESGQYRYHFEAQAGDFGSVRYPLSPADDFQFVVANPITRYIVLGLGLLVCLFLLPFVSYTATRGLNQRGDPAAAARIALLIGIVAFIVLTLCVLTLNSVEYVKWLSYALGGVLVLAVLVGLFSRRRTV